MGRVQNKVAIITGAASGLGFAAARMLLKEGAKVVLTDVNREVLDSMPERLNDFSQSQFQTFYHDVTQEDSWVELINKTCLLYTSPSPRDATLSRMPSSA